jgi:hypothetical protein
VKPGATQTLQASHHTAAVKELMKLTLGVKKAKIPKAYKALQHPGPQLPVLLLP